MSGVQDRNWIMAISERFRSPVGTGAAILFPAHSMSELTAQRASIGIIPVVAIDPALDETLPAVK